MAFDYGKDTLGIHNPFKTEGVLEISKGLIILLMGIILVFNITDDIRIGAKTMAWIKLSTAAFFLSWGVKAMTTGSFRVFRFLVGRNVPANLCVEKDEKNRSAKQAYAAADLAEMLKKRLNPTFGEKESFISRLVISMVPNFLFLPPGFRNMVEGITTSFLQSLVSTLIFFLGLFAVKTGLLELKDGDAVLEWFGLLLIVRLFVVWYKNRPSNKRINSVGISKFKMKTLIFAIVFAIILPVVLELLVQNGLELPVLGINVPGVLLTTLVSGLAISFSVFFLCHIRVKETVPNTAVSEYKEELQLNMHPRDLFRFFELEMADKRHKELPNRIYRELRPTLEMEGSQNRGNFSGDTIQETQPIYKEVIAPKILEKTRFIIAILGRLFALLGCALIYFEISGITEDTMSMSMFNTILYAFLFFVFHYYLVRAAHIFWAEILFSSHLVQFFSNGTFSESKIATGMSVYDSTRSENSIVQTKSTSWIFVSNIVTSTIASSDTNNLEGTRYVLEMNKDEDFLMDVINGLNKYTDENKLIASMKSKGDIENISNVHQLNEITRAKMQDPIGELRNNSGSNLDQGKNEALEGK